MEADKENREEELPTGAAAPARPAMRQSSSKLVEVPDTTRYADDQTENTTAIARRKSKRVSFAGTKIVKVFQSHATDGSWDSSYAALVSSSSSDSSVTATTLDTGHDITHEERSRTSLVLQPQLLPVDRQQTPHHLLQDSRQHFENEYEVVKPSHSGSSHSTRYSSTHDMARTAANYDANEMNRAGNNDLNQTCVSNTDMELTCAVENYHRSALQISDDQTDYTELTNAASSVRNTHTQSDALGIANMNSTSDACIVANILRNVAPIQVLEQQVSTPAMVRSQSSSATEPSAENEDTQGLADMEFTCAVPNLQQKSRAISPDNEDTRGLADMELTCAVPNLQQKPRAISPDNEDTRGLADMELTCAVPNLQQKPHAISSDNEDTRGLADMELTCAVPNLQQKPHAISPDNEDTRGLADMELTCAVPNLQQKPRAISPDNEDTRGLADMELTCAVPNLQQKPRAISPDNEDTRGLADMEFTCVTSGIQKIIMNKFETTCTTSSYASMQCISTSNKDMVLSVVSANTISGMVSQNVTEQQCNAGPEARMTSANLVDVNCGFAGTKGVSSNSAEFPLSSNGQIGEEERKSSENATGDNANRGAPKKNTRRKSILSNKSKYNNEKTVSEEEKTVQFSMEADVYEHSRTSVMNDVTHNHTKDKGFEDIRNSKTNDTLSCSRVGDNDTTTSATQSVEAVLDTVPLPNTTVSTLTVTSKSVGTSSAIQQPRAVMEQASSENLSKSLCTVPALQTSGDIVNLVASGKRRSLENSVIAPEKVFIMSSDKKDDTKMVYRTNHFQEISDPLSLLLPATSDDSDAPVATNVSQRVPSPELVEVKEEMNDSNSSQNFPSNVTIQLVDSDDSLMSSPEKTCNVSARDDPLAVIEDQRPKDHRRSSAACAAALASCRALLESTQSVVAGDTTREAQTMRIDSIVNDLNKSLSAISDNPKEEGEGSMIVQDIKLEDVSISTNDKDDCASINASVVSEMELKTDRDTTKSHQISTTMEMTDIGEIDKTLNQDNFQTSDLSPGTRQRNSIEINTSDNMVTKGTEIQILPEHSSVSMLQTVDNTAQVISTEACVDSDSSAITNKSAPNSSISPSFEAADKVMTAETRQEPYSIGSAKSSTQASMESVEAAKVKTLPANRPRELNINQSPVAGPVSAAVPQKTRMSVMQPCPGCSPLAEGVIYKDSRDTVILHREGSTAVLKLHHRKFCVRLSLASSGPHCTVKDTHWQPSLQELKRPMARLAVSTYKSTMTRSCEVLRSLRVCCLNTMLDPVLSSFNAVSELLFDLFSLLKRFAVQFEKDRVVVLLRGRQGAVVKVTCVLLGETSAPTPRYKLHPAAHSMYGSIRATSVVAAMKDVEAGPHLITRTIDAAVAVVEMWQQ